ITIKALTFSILSCLSLISIAADPNTAGKDFARGQLERSAEVVNPSSAQETPFFNPTPAHASKYTGTDLFSIGTSRIVECEVEEAGADKIANQECAAVNFLAKNPDSRKRFELNTNDPALVAGRDAMHNAKKPEFTDNGCVLETTITPAET